MAIRSVIGVQGTSKGKCVAIQILRGDSRDVLKTLPDESIQSCITSPPYYGLRDYGVEGQIGLESTPEAFVIEMVAIFREVRRVLRADGTLWLNLGDSYSRSGGRANAQSMNCLKDTHREAIQSSRGCASMKPKDLIGIPWMVAFALRADGWYLRQDIIWSKPNSMPESVKDRCTKAHEYLFLLTKSPQYYYDAESIAEDAIYSDLSGQDESGYKDAGFYSGKHSRSARDSFKRTGSKREAAMHGQSMGTHRPDRPQDTWNTAKRNKRSVWSVPTSPYAEAHFATFPPDLIEPCVKAGCPTGGMVLDPFGGAGTTGMVADRLGRNAILIELNPEYADIAKRRIKGDAGMFAEVS